MISRHANIIPPHPPHPVGSVREAQRSSYKCVCTYVCYPQTHTHTHAHTYTHTRTHTHTQDEIHNTVTSLKLWTEHLDRLTHRVASSHQSLLIEDFDLRSEGARALDSSTLLQALIRRGSVQSRFITIRDNMTRLARSVQPIARAKLLRAAARRHAIYKANLSATRIQACVRGAGERRRLGAWMSLQRQRRAKSTLSSATAEVELLKERVLVIVLAMSLCTSSE
jgi:hypothetical protein